jgi:hypothetical protein
VQGGYRAIVKDADPKIVGAINDAPGNYSSASEALHALLHRTSSMVLNELRKDGFSESNKTGDFAKIVLKESPYFPQVPSSGLYQGSAVVPTRGAFGSGANATLFGEYKTPQGPPSEPGQALTAIPTGGHFGATSSEGVFGNDSAGHASFGQFPSNITVTLNFNSFPASVNNKDESEDGLSGSFALRPKKLNSDGPDAATVSLYQTGPKPKSMFADSPHETNDHENTATGDPGSRFGDLLEESSARYLDPEQNHFVNYVPSGILGSESHGVSGPATGAFASTTGPSPCGDFKVPHGSYRYNPTTGTLKATEKVSPEATVTSNFKDTITDGKTPESKSMVDGNTNKKARRHFATVEDETLNSFAALTTNTSKPVGFMFKEFIPREISVQRPTPAVSMFGDAPASALTPVQGSMFESASTAEVTMDTKGSAFPPVSGFASAPVSKFATATVPAGVAEPETKTVEVERPVQQGHAQKIPLPAQKKTASKSGGLFESMYAK